MSTLTMSNLITQYLQQNAEEEVREQKYFNIFFIIYIFLSLLNTYFSFFQTQGAVRGVSIQVLFSL